MSQTTFLEMLSFARPAWTPYEEAFITRYITPLNPMVDTFGNQIVDVGSNPKILWSSHTDTVHDRSGFQELIVENGFVRRKHPTKKEKKVLVKAGSQPIWDECLGADCTTGVYIMIEMIKAGVEGRYIFHRAEEIGCLGSKFIRDETPDMLKGINAAIAFDRKGTDEIITTQGSYRTASDKFAQSLADTIGGKYVPSPKGSVTDTKMYAPFIAECTNISVGYHNQHSGRERQDLIHLKWLVERMVKFNPYNLIIDRTPAAEPPYRGYRGGSTFYGSGAYDWNYGQEETIEDLVRNYPNSVAEILDRAGMTFFELDNAIYQIQEERRAAAQAKTPRLIA